MIKWNNVLKGIISYRHKLSSDDFLRDFNAIPVIFFEHERIKCLFRECYDSYQKKEEESVSKRKLNSVILAICDELDYKDITESDINFIFTPKQ